MIERLIITGLINSTEYLQQIRVVWDGSLIGSRSIALIASWCIEFYDENNEAPDRHIEDIYYDKKDSGGIPRDMVEEIEEDLEDLANEYDESFNVGYALKRTDKYFKQRTLELHQEQVQNLIDDGQDDAAQSLASNFKGHSAPLTDDLDLGGGDASLKVENAFKQAETALIEYPGALGKIFNDQLIRGGFVSLMASEKRGKSFWLLDMAVRATLKRNKVAFFQAGDMTEGQQIKRMASYLTKLPSNDSYAGKVYVPHADCMLQQLDLCDKEERRCNSGIFTGGEFNPENIRKDITKEHLMEAFEDFEDDYRPCTNCPEFKTRRLGTPWLVPEDITHAVTVDEANRKIKSFFQNKKRNFHISTHPNDSLTVSNIRSILDRWERMENFIPDVIVIDYADLLVPEKTTEFRHGQNEIWKNLRALSQSRNCLVLTATQADAKSYEKNVLTMSNYSEDKRKFAHVTVMYGLNQDKRGREKRMGIMRINTLVQREGEFDSTSTVTVLQSLNLGQPFLDSFI